MQARDTQVRLARAIAMLVLAVAAPLLVLHFRSDAREGLEAPVVANAVAISAGLVVAGLTLVALSRRRG